MKGKRSTRRPRSATRRNRRPIPPGTHQATISKVEVTKDNNLEVTARVQTPMTEDARDIRMMVGGPETKRPAPGLRSLDLELANDRFVTMARARARWLQALDQYDNLDPRHEDFMDGQQKIQTAYSEYWGAVSAYRRTVCLNGDVTES